MKNRGLVLTCLLVLLASCTPVTPQPATLATVTPEAAAITPVPTETAGATAGTTPQPAYTPAPESGGSSTNSEVAEYLSWYQDNGLPLVLDMGRTLSELDKRMSRYDIAGMCELPGPNPAKFRDQLVAKPAPERVTAVRDKTLQLVSEFEQAESDVFKYCATIDVDALARAAGHINKYARIAEQLTSEVSALGAEYGLR
jgi:hypothetical protein